VIYILSVITYLYVTFKFKMASLISREFPSTHRASSLNDFFVERKIGDGAYSQVFKVIRKSDQREYAMKQVSPLK
jgi:serine/threonine protein kinase